MSELVSVVITTHNRLGLLKKAINSVLNQTYKNIECIVVDDASADGTREYMREKIKEVNNLKYKYIKKENSNGGNHARNVGIEISQGKYLAFLDDDDEFFLNKIEKQVHFIECNPQYEFIYCGMQIEDIKDNMNVFSNQNCEKLPQGDLKKYILMKMLCLTSTMFLTKRILKEVGFFDENIKYWQDYELCIRLCQKTEVGVIKENLIKYRRFNTGNRLTNNLSGWQESVSYIYKKHDDLFRNLTHEELGVRDLYYMLDGISRSRKCREKKQVIHFTLEIIMHLNILKALLKKILNKTGIGEFEII